MKRRNAIRLVLSIEECGIEIGRASTAEFTDFVTKQVAEWTPAVKASGATLN